MIWRRTLFAFLVIITGLLLETTVFGSNTLGGTQPELVLLIVIAIAMEEGPAVGCLCGFFAGLATDLLLQLPKGLSAFVFTSIGYAVGAMREQLQGTTAWLRIAVAGVGTALGLLLYGGMAALMGISGIELVSLLRRAGLAAAYSMLLAPFVVPFIRRVSMKLRPRKVVKL
ncbi:MAG: rod shape-determining protein MreD [Actinomycetota bacterium]